MLNELATTDMKSKWVESFAFQSFQTRLCQANFQSLSWEFCLSTSYFEFKVFATAIQILEFGILEGIQFWMVHKHGQQLLLPTAPSVIFFPSRRYIYSPLANAKTLLVFTVPSSQLKEMKWHLTQCWSCLISRLRVNKFLLRRWSVSSGELTLP